MSELVGQSAYIARRHILHTFRQPWLIAINLVQPFLWLLLFSGTFRRIADIPGFGSDNYAQFFLPGLIVMTVLLASGWNGLSLLADMERGTLDRLLASPVRPIALIIGPLVQQVVNAVIPTAILLVVGYGLGVRFHGGVLGVVVMILALAGVACALAALSSTVALIVGREESLIAMVNFIVMPLTFLSSAFMPKDLVPGWVAAAIAANPVNWAVELCRDSFNDSLELGKVLTGLGLLAGLAAVAMATTGVALARHRRRS
ncbi:ABC transporter permease [Micromonospora sp. NPDC049051]|uniref:ABC transporter permease n=1 Tax=unclassified Micromonospora TaxID=2617518 RepID=UPI000CB06AAB